MQNEICEKCAGCRACEMACPANAIEMVEDVEGFRFPHIIEEKCISCNICKKICPQNSRLSVKGQLNTHTAYAAQFNNDEILMTSSSGAFFAALALEVLEGGGVVFGVEMNQDYHAVHTIIENKRELYRIRSSKYVASDPLTSFKLAKEKLDTGKVVLFSGCPCQIAGLKAYLRKPYENLVTVDIVCHGTPSQKLFDVYRTGMEEKFGAPIEKYQSRDKEKYGWGVYWSYILNGKKKYGGLHDDPYCSTFIDHSANRECCYQCRYVGIENRSGDITLGDYWGVDVIHPEMASNKGVSAVISNTAKGQEWVEKALRYCRYVESTVENIARYNPSLVKAAERPAYRDLIYKGIDEKNPAQFLDENLHIPVKKIVKTKIRLMIPYKARVFIKKLKKGL